VRYVRGAVRADGARVTIEPSAEERVLDARLASLLTDILSDREARAGSFGLDGVLSLPFPVAVKTGTSKGLRDNWAIGYTREVTVAVWAGNFDGSPLVRSSGVTGAAPLFREVMLAAMRKRSPAALDDHAGLVQAEICALSGALATRDCPHHLREWFVPGREPHAACEMHERVRIDRQTELRAGASCRDAEERVFERYEAPYESWAARAERPLAPRAYAPRCPGPPSAEVFSAELVFPTPGAHFVLDPLGPARQEIMLQARASSGREGLSFLVDGHVVGRSEAPFQVPWPLAPGLHTAVVARGAEQSSPVTFVVRDGR
jgi:penicillin-binding protein 1C